ncbi:protein misato homolog 1 isoform X2 [Grus americana]|uniref:protein misato homolog 1 isoform X2 n=1 Tax=Grus americana TaxID=9117 RepID=UPI0024079753|nr:protein misato homolog 1 isoform X2 [Grus americana]
MPGEAVTLQLGHYAGCVGAHWWGLQAAALRSPAEAAELRATALLRAERAAGGRETLTPRLVALELKGGVGALRPGGGGPEAPVAWDGEVAAYLECASAGGSAPRDAGRRTEDASSERKGSSSSSAQGASPAPSRRRLSQEVYSGSSTQLWSDYLNVRLHPKSIYVIRQYMHDGDCGCLEAFGQGESLLQDPGCIEELEDRLHFYVEECDYLQGFQVLCDLHNGFSGVGAKVTELLCDEYSGKGILTWGLAPVISNMGDSQKNFYRLMNTALGIVHLSSHSSLFCPLSLSGSLGIKPQPPVTFPYINYDASLDYHSSAVLAAALDTLTAPYRLCSSQGSMMHLAETLNFSGRKVVAAWASVPFPALHGYSLPDTLCAYQQDVPWKFLSSCRERKVSCCFAQSVVLRGLCQESHISCPGKQPTSPLHMYESTEQILQRYLHTVFPGAFSTSHVLEQPCSTLPPYPQFFSPLLTRQGFLLDKPPSYSSTAVESIPVLAALQSSPVLHTLLYSLYKDLQQLNMRRWASFFAAGVEEDDFQEALEELRTLSQCYETGFEAEDSEDEADSD